MVEHAMGGKPSDFIWTTFVTPKLISDRVAALLHEAKVAGWSTYPVRVVGKDSLEIEGFHGLAVSGRCGPIDPTLSELFLKPPPVPQGKACWHRKGLFFEPRSWDGSDIFAPSGGGGFVFVVDRVKRLFEKAKVRNVKLTRLTEYEVLVPSWELPPEFRSAQ